VGIVVAVTQNGALGVQHFISAIIKLLCESARYASPTCSAFTRLVVGAPTTTRSIPPKYDICDKRLSVVEAGSRFVNGALVLIAVLRAVAVHDVRRQTLRIPKSTCGRGAKR
jgi:hypothetical protein